MNNIQTFNERLTESLAGIIEIRSNMPDADFYIMRKGSIESIGTPSKPTGSDLDLEKFGVKCNQEVILPDYMFYMVQYLHQSGQFKQFAHGTLRLQSLRVDDVKLVIAKGLMGQAR